MAVVAGLAHPLEGLIAVALHAVAAQQAQAQVIGRVGIAFRHFGQGLHAALGLDIDGRALECGQASVLLGAGIAVAHAHRWRAGQLPFRRLPGASRQAQNCHEHQRNGNTHGNPTPNIFIFLQCLEYLAL
ncbi:hypothetical protein D3C85_1389900 [compost metagenome]